VTLTLFSLVIWTTAGLIEDRPRWSMMTCQEVRTYAEETIERYGGQYELECEEFRPIHEADLNPEQTFEE
jgi:hypothetical protein